MIGRKKGRRFSRWIPLSLQGLSTEITLEGPWMDSHSQDKKDGVTRFGEKVFPYFMLSYILFSHLGMDLDDEICKSTQVMKNWLRSKGMWE